MDSFEIVLYFDPMHSEKYVVKLLTTCLPNVSETRATNLFLVAQTNDRCVVFRGFLEHVEHFTSLMERFPYEAHEDFVLPPMVFEILDPTGKRIE